MRRVNVRGVTGSGKTTTSKRIAVALGVPHIELDALYHGPNWSEPTADVFRSRVEAAVAAAPDGWVIDGSYDSKLRGFVLDRADTLVFLDVRLRTALRRIWRRTWQRIMRRERLWNENRETFRNAFLSRDSLFLWLLKTHPHYGHALAARIADHPHLRVVHLRTPREIDRFLETVRADNVERAAWQP